MVVHGAMEECQPHQVEQVEKGATRKEKGATHQVEKGAVEKGATHERDGRCCTLSVGRLVRRYSQRTMLRVSNDE